MDLFWCAQKHENDGEIFELEKWIYRFMNCLRNVASSVAVIINWIVTARHLCFYYIFYEARVQTVPGTSDDANELLAPHVFVLIVTH